mgnify:CR=1 FL=1
MSFAPVYDDRSRALILGTWPSPKSREMAFYYGHPQNRFWPLLAALTGFELTRGVLCAFHRRQKAAAFAPRAGAVGYAGKLHHYRRIGCLHPGCGAQRYRRAAAQSTHPGGVLQRCHSLPYLYKISAAAYRHPGCPSAQYKPRQRRLQPRPAGGALGRCAGGLDRKMMTRL